MLKRRWTAIGLCAALMCAALPAAGEEYSGTVNADKVIFRITPSKDGFYHCRLDEGTQVTVTGESGDYYKVRYDGDLGYIMQEFIDLSKAGQKALGEKSKSRYASVSSISALGDAPAFTRKGSSGEDVEKLQQALKIKGYYDGNVDGLYGDQTAAAVKAYQKKMGLRENGKADYDTILKLFGEVSETTVSNDPQMKGMTRISQIEVPATSEKGDSGKKVVALQQALKIKGYYKAPIDGDYGDKTEAAVRAFQKSRGLSQDGVAGNQTIKALFGKDAADYTFKTERLDWFNGGEDIIPKGATFTIKDVNTGKTFTVKRWSGYNHLDAEPLTDEDTAVMKQIYGGEWSWRRRAILVKYDGHVYAASMNGMPHGTTTISGNDFDGHFCIHFYKSRTHETNRVDQEHQNAVERAMNASW